MSKESLFIKRQSIKQIEESTDFAPKFDDNGLIPVCTTDALTGELLMHAYMNQDALEMTLRSGEAVYFSRSRQVVWHKGKTSGLVQKVREIRIDDDQDCIWLRVEVKGEASCHVGYRSCFYRSVPFGSTIKHDNKVNLTFEEDEKLFEPEDIYGDAPNPTII